MVRQLLPWHENLGKRQVKSPKVHVRDSGLLHQLLGTLKPDDAYFRATHSGAELDLLLMQSRKSRPRRGGRCFDEG